MTPRSSRPQLPATWTLAPAAYDAPAVQQLLRQFQAAQTEIYGYADDPMDTPAEDFAPPTGLFLLARDASHQPVGCGGWRQLDATTGEIKRMYVHPVARRHSLGRQMLHMLEEDARHHGLTHIQLETGVSNHAALALYRSRGYHPIDAYRIGRNPAINRALRRAL